MIDFKKSAAVVSYFCRSCVNKNSKIDKDPCKECLKKGFIIGFKNKPIPINYQKKENENEKVHKAY